MAWSNDQYEKADHHDDLFEMGEAIEVLESQDLNLAFKESYKKLLEATKDSEPKIYEVLKQSEDPKDVDWDKIIQIRKEEARQ